MTKLTLTARLLLLLAALWATGIGAYLLLTPQIGSMVIATASQGQHAISLETTVEQSWYQRQGLWGVIILVIFAALFLAALPLAWRRHRRRLLLLVSTTLFLCLLAGFSIGLLYLPAALIQLAAAFLLQFAPTPSRTMPTR